MTEDNTQTSNKYDEEDRIFSLIKSLSSEWRWLASGSAIGFLSVISFLSLTPTKYAAEALILPAVVGSSTSFVEPISQTLQRLKLQSFYGDEIVKECHASSRTSLLNDRLKVGVIRGSNILRVEYAANSAVVAETCVAKVVERLKQSQEAIGALMIKAIEDQLVYTKKQIENRERDLAEFEARGARGRSPTLAESTLMIIKRDELIKLYAKYQDESRMLAEPYTQPMKLLGPIYSNKEAVSLRILFATISGLIGGLCFGLLALFLTRAWSRYKSYLRRSGGQGAQ